MNRLFLTQIINIEPYYVKIYQCPHTEIHDESNIEYANFGNSLKTSLYLNCGHQ